MKLKIVLERTVEVEHWRVVGTIGKSVKRTDMLPMLLHAKDNYGTRADDLAEHLFFEARSRRVVAERMLRIAVVHGLLMEDGTNFVLTPEGEEAIRTGEVFIPEQGTWAVWGVDEGVLVTDPILKLEPTVGPTAFEEVRGESRDALRSRPFRSIPEWIERSCGKVLGAKTPAGSAMRIEALEPRGEFLGGVGSLRLVWDVTNRSLRLEGVLSGDKIAMDLEAPDADAADMWRELLQRSNQWTNWDATAGALRVDFSTTSGVERLSMLRDLTFPTPMMGYFHDTVVRGVPLLATSQAEAQQWAEWRLSERVQDYATKERFATWAREAAAPFGEFKVVLSSRAALAARAWTQRGERASSKTWNLVAAEDWRL